jgi:hypothetical protein
VADACGVAYGGVAPGEEGLGCNGAGEVHVAEPDMYGRYPGDAGGGSGRKVPKPKSAEQSEVGVVASAPLAVRWAVAARERSGGVAGGVPGRAGQASGVLATERGDGPGWLPHTPDAAGGQAAVAAWRDRTHSSVVWKPLSRLLIVRACTSGPVLKYAVFDCLMRAH